MDIELFFKNNSIDDFSIGNVDTIKAPKGFHPKDILPESKRIIVFGKLIPEYIFKLDCKIKSYYLYKLIDKMDKVSFELCEILNKEGFSSISVPTFFPARIRKGKIRGIISLKHCAEAVGMGSIGENTLLISKTFGNRLCLSAVLTQKSFNIVTNCNNDELCLKCNRCIDICPTHAIGNKGLEVTKCVNFTHSIPKFLKPVILIMMQMKCAEKYVENMVNIMGWNSDMICSDCLTVCPHFGKNINSYNDANSADAKSSAAD